MPPISGAKKRSGETSSSLRPALAISSAAVMPWMAAIVVVEQHVLGRLDRAGDDVPARGDEVVAGIERRVLRQAAGRDDRPVGLRRQHVVRLRPRRRSGSRRRAARARQAASRRCRSAPCGAGSARRAVICPPACEAASSTVDANGRARRRRAPPPAPPRRRRRPPPFSADRRFARSHAGSSPRARSRHCGCRAPRRPRRCGRGSRWRRRRGGCGAPRPPSPCATICGSAMCGPRHADHVELAGGDRVPGGRDVGDARGVEDRELASPPSPRRRNRDAARSACPVIGMTLVSAASVSIEPRMMLRKSTLPRAASRRAISMPSSLATGPSRNPRRRPCGCRR